MDASRYSAIESLRDGRPLEIRAADPADQDGFVEALGRMSNQSIRRRFFRLKRHFSEQELDYFTDVDFVQHVALVAVLTEDGAPHVIGGARYVVIGPANAEVAFAVIDPYQGLGIGSLLLRHLATIARGAGITQWSADVLPDNDAMLRVFASSGFSITTRREDDALHLDLHLR